jgi:hypothetical protein
VGTMAIDKYRIQIAARFWARNMFISEPDRMLMARAMVQRPAVWKEALRRIPAWLIFWVESKPVATDLYLIWESTSKPLGSVVAHIPDTKW